MPYTQRDLVWIKDAQMPDGKRLTHPFLILSCEVARRKEPGHYYGIMMTGSAYKDMFSLPVGEKLTDLRASTPVNIRRSFEGFVFLEKGGYVKQNQELKSDREWLRTLQIRQDRMATRLFWINFVLALAGIAAALYYLNELCARYHWCSFCK